MTFSRIAPWWRYDLFRKNIWARACVGKQQRCELSITGDPDSAFSIVTFCAEWSDQGLCVKRSLVDVIYFIRQSVQRGIYLISIHRQRRPLELK